MNETIKKLVEIFIEKPYHERMGSGKLSRKYNCTIEEVKLAKTVAFKSNQINNNDKSKYPKILILDIETAPVKAYVWQLWKQNVYIDQIVSDWFCLSWSAKWLYSDEMMSDVLTSKEALEEDDSRIIKSIWLLLNEAQIIIAHNSKKFDIPKLNARFILHGLSQTKPYKQIDTLEVAKKQFNFSSNKLDYLAQMFGIEKKHHTTFELWTKCLQGDEASLKQMEEYNKHDVEILEEVYIKLRPWIQGHPNLGLYIESDVPVCSGCGCTDIKPFGEYCTSIGKYQVYKCTECNSLSRTRVNSFDKTKRNNLLTVIPR